MHVQPPVRWYRKWWVMLSAMLVLLLAGLIGWKTYREWKFDQELEARLLQLDQAEPHWRFEQWEQRYPKLPEDQNLAYYATQIKSTLGTEPEEFHETFEEVDTYPNRTLSELQVVMLKALLNNSQALPEEMDQLLKRKIGYFPMKDHRDPSFRVITVTLTPQQNLRSIANLLIQQTRLWTQENKPEMALKACESLLHLPHAMMQEPYFISHLINIAIQSMAVSSCERVLAQTEPKEADLVRLQERMLKEANISLFRIGLQGERGISDRFLREIAEGKYSAQELSSLYSFPSSPKASILDDILHFVRNFTRQSPFGYIPEARIQSLKYFDEALELTANDQASIDDLKKLYMKYAQQTPTVGFMASAIIKVFEADQKRRAQLRMGAALLAAERYRLATGQIATGWNDLVPAYYPTVPLDPYNLKPLLWKKTATGFILYSVWMNSHDDGGLIRRDQRNQVNQVDFGVEYFAPAFRRQPPLPVTRKEESPLPTGDDKEAWFAAARTGDLARMKELFDTGFDINTKSDYGATALCFAAEKGHIDIVKWLIEHKIDINAKDTFYNADAITWAMMKDQHESVGLLLKAGAKGETSLLANAIFQNKPKLVQAILANSKIKQETLDSSLSSLDPKKTEIAKLLTEAGAKLKPKSEDKKADEKKPETPAKTTPAKTEEATEPTGSVKELTTKPTQAVPWPIFRGVGNTGVVDGQYPPSSWDAVTKKHLLWKTFIPGLGLSCPVVWGNQVFLTTAINQDSAKPSLRIGQYGDVDSVKETAIHTWKTYCLDASSGKVLWEKTAYMGVPKVKRHMKSSHANATPATDGKHVVVNFGSEGLYCYSMTGQQLWKKELGKLGSGWFFNPDYEWGFGSSPILFEDQVIVQCDIGKNSFIAAYSLEDGAQLWMTPRDEIPSWCTPTLIRPEKGPPELVTVASKYARGYNPSTGEELWKLGKFSEIAVPTPFYAQGLIFLTTGYRPIQPIYAVKPGARGDISLEKGKESNDYIAWSKSRGGPYLPTPLVYGEHLYVCSNSGVLSCYEAKTGKVIYQKRLAGKNGYTASLVAADGRIYCTDEEGVVRVVQAGTEFKLLAVNKLGEECLCHPAISNGRIFFRGRDHVMAFGIEGNQAK